MGAARAMSARHERLLTLSSAYRGWNRRQLGEALGRDPTKLYPPNGNPKLDYLIRLAGVLDWPVGIVAEAIWEDPDRKTPAPDLEGLGFDELDEKAKSAHREGNWELLLHLAEAMFNMAEAPEQKARARHRESAAWDGMGRYLNQLEAVQSGLRQMGVSRDLRCLLEVNLANSYYTLWHLPEARAMAVDIQSRFSQEPPTTRALRASEAFSHYVLGNTYRRLGLHEPDTSRLHASNSKKSLEIAKQKYLELADEFDNEPWRGIAHTCDGAMLEARVELGEMSAEEALEKITGELESIDVPDSKLVGDALESYGWWCVFGCNIALRHLEGRDLQRHMSVHTSKGYDIADKLNNWALRERLFTHEFAQRQRLNELAGIDVEWMVDKAELRVLVGTMGRFPAFRETGWKILESATIVGEG